MKELIKPQKLHKGDLIATISISGGRAGDEDMLWRYELGKRRLEEAFGLRVVEAPHALRGSRYLYENPQARAEDLHWALENPGYRVLQGQGKVQGRLMGGCMGPLQQILGTEAFPSPEAWEGSIIFLEGVSPYGSLLAWLHGLRALAAAGVFEKACGLLTGDMNQEEAQTLQKFLKYEAGREDLPVLANVDFCHRTPMTVLPMGALGEIDCGSASFAVLESGTAEGA